MYFQPLFVILFLVSITTSIIFFTPVKEYIPGYDTTEMRLRCGKYQAFRLCYDYS